MTQARRPLAVAATSAVLVLAGAGSAWACGDGSSTSGTDPGTYPGSTDTSTSTTTTSSSPTTTATAARTARRHARRARYARF